MAKKSEKISSLSGLSRASPDLIDVLSIDHRSLDDRSLAIVTGANVEKSLEDHIARRMQKLSAEELKALFEAEGAPLGTFSAKIKVGHAFGVFGRSTKADLETVRRLRNVFAHARKPVSFISPAIADACQRLQTPNRFPDKITILSGYDASKMRDRFLGTCNLIQFSLAFRGADITDFKPHPLD